MRKDPTNAECTEAISLREQVVALCDLSQHLPPRDGKRVHISTVYRWADRGINGVRLSTLRIGGTRYTSIEAVERFIAALESRTQSPENPNA